MKRKCLAWVLSVVFLLTCLPSLALAQEGDVVLPQNTEQAPQEPAASQEPDATQPVAEASAQPTAEPTDLPQPTAEPTFLPEPSAEPTMEPEPTAEASTQPAAEPSASPATQPTVQPTAQPSASPVPTPSETPVTESVTVPEVSGTYVPGELIVVFREDASLRRARSTSAVLSFGEVEEIIPTQGEPAALVSIPDTITVQEAIDEAMAQPEVAYAQPNYIYPLLETQGTFVDDPYQQYALKSVLANQAWDLARTEKKVRVAVLDTGIQMDHPDLAGVVDHDSSWDVVENRPLTTDTNGHGTHVAGIVAAQVNNGIGIAGVSYNAEIVGYGVFRNYTDVNGKPYYGASSVDVAKAYDRLLNEDVRVVNMSLGSLKVGGENENWKDEMVCSRIDQAAAQGIVTVCAAGNDGVPAGVTAFHYPSDYETCIAVTSVDANNVVAFNSSYNQFKDIAAPGVLIDSTYKGSSYRRMSGTSMASPLVSGVVALMLSVNPALGVDQVKQILYATATDLGDPGHDPKYGHGKVNAYAAVAQAMVLQIQQPSVTPMIGAEVQMRTNTAAQGANAPVVWSVQNETGSATITPEGVLTGTGSGTVTVRAHLRDFPDKQASLQVAIPNIYVAGIGGALQVQKGGTLQLEARKASGTVPATGWRVASGTGSATVTAEGLLRGIRVGTVQVQATLSDETQAMGTITVLPQLVTALSVQDTGAIYEADIVAFSAQVQPQTADNQAVTWSVQNGTGSATMTRSGMLTAIRAGSVTVKAAARDGSGIIGQRSIEILPLCRITFDAQGGSNVSAVRVRPGGVLTEPVSPTRMGYTFAGWHMESSGEHAWNFATAVAQSMTLYAKWEPRRATIVATAGAGGSIEPSGSTALPYGQSQTYTITPDNGYRIGAVTVDGKEMGKVPRYTFQNLLADVTIAVTFEAEVTGVTLNQSVLSLNAGTSASLRAVVEPANTPNRTVFWSSSNSDVATVDQDGNVRARSAGSAIITATTSDGAKTAQCVVTVKKPVSKINLTTRVGLMQGRKVSLLPEILPVDAGNRSLRWKSNNTRVASVDAKGIVTGRKPGKAILTAYAKDGSGVWGKCQIIVSASMRPVERVQTAPVVAKMKVGTSGRAKARVSPADASNRTIRWTSSNPRIATVSQKGLVKAISKGTVYITASAMDGSGKKSRIRLLIK